MIVLDEYEKKICRLAIQIFENDRVITSGTAHNNEVVEAENLSEELRPQLEECIDEHPKAFTELKRKLVGR